MKNRVYCIGLKASEILEYENEEIFSYSICNNGDDIIINWKNNEYNILEKQGNSYIEISEIEITRGVVKQLNDDGSRWEGDWYNEKPFGFGTEYFADTHQVDYCGNFMNDKRHGWGESYDRNNLKLYEGDWRCGNNNFEDERIVIEDNCEEDCLRIHDLIKELVIGENCLKEIGDLERMILKMIEL